MTYKLFFDEQALKEWQSLDESVRKQFKKALANRLGNPRIESAKLSGMKDCYKITLKSVGYRLVYQVEDGAVTVTVISVGRRDKNLIYKKAIERLNEFLKERIIKKKKKIK